MQIVRIISLAWKVSNHFQIGVMKLCLDNGLVKVLDRTYKYGTLYVTK